MSRVTTDMAWAMYEHSPRKDLLQDVRMPEWLRKAAGVIYNTPVRKVCDWEHRFVSRPELGEPMP